MNHKSCEHCVYWDGLDSIDGYCRCGLPSSHGLWPRTYSSDWCGKLKEKFDLSQENEDCHLTNEKPVV